MKFYQSSCIIFSIFISSLLAAGNLAAFGVGGATDNNAEIIIVENATSEEAANISSGDSSIAAMEKKHIGNSKSIEAGRKKYGNTCLFCHGAKGIGARAPTLVTKGFAPGGVNGNNYFITTIKYGKPGTIMGSFEGTLTETEMWQIISYLRDQARLLSINK